MIERIILGCHNLTGGSSYWSSKRLIDAAFDLGIRRFDVAPSYGLGTAEETLGRSLGKRRFQDDVEITSKFGQLPPRFGRVASWVREPHRLIRRLGGPKKPPPMPAISRSATAQGRKEAWLPNSVSQAAMQSMRKLGVERIHCFLVHERLPTTFIPTLVDELETLRQAGSISRFGLSGEIGNVQEMLAAISTPDIVQVSISELEEAPSCRELRVFNLRRTAHNGKEESEAETARQLATRARGLLSSGVHTSLLFNSSSPRRLELFLRSLES